MYVNSAWQVPCAGESCAVIVRWPLIIFSMLRISAPVMIPPVDWPPATGVSVCCEGWIVEMGRTRNNKLHHPIAGKPHIRGIRITSRNPIVPIHSANPALPQGQPAVGQLVDRGYRGEIDEDRERVVCVVVGGHEVAAGTVGERGAAECGGFGWCRSRLGRRRGDRRRRSGRRRRRGARRDGGRPLLGVLRSFVMRRVRWQVKNRGRRGGVLRRREERIQRVRSCHDGPSTSTSSN